MRVFTKQELEAIGESLPMGWKLDKKTGAVLSDKHEDGWVINKYNKAGKLIEKLNDRGFYMKKIYDKDDNCIAVMDNNQPH